MVLAPFSIAGRHVLVTGGAGFIGSHLVDALLARGAGRVTIVDSMRFANEHHATLARDRVDVHRFRLGFDPVEKLAPALAGVELAFHLAAEKHNQSLATPAELLVSNVEGTRALYEALARAGCRKIVFSSSLYAYGRVAGARLVEGEPTPPWTLYGISKLAGEHLGGHARHEWGLHAVALRYFFTYGPRQFPGTGYKSVIVANFERLRRGEAPIINGDGMQALDYVYVDDVVDATIRAMESSLDGEVLNVGSGAATTIEALTREMLAVTGSKLTHVHGPSDWTENTSRVADVAKIGNALGWRATTPLAEGLRRTFEWVSRG
ncbi:MAG TPA: NAD-dependent epimerase/dehydratase family protein [Polyangia bacterium]|nr:NAD-dependent epimerase/dehydratase family protein [Polyangia bacterium]